VEGASELPTRSADQINRHANDRISRFINLTRQIVCRNMNYRYALTFKPSIAAVIALRPVAHVMTRAVNLDGEPRFRAIEIKYVWSDWMLTAEARFAWRAPA
jgi:hypothetical protein